MTVLDGSLGEMVMEISASIENGGGSRTQLDGTENNGVVWSADDQLSVFLGNATNLKFILESGAGTGNATFKGTGDLYINAGTETNKGTQANVAYYPYASDVSLSYDVTTGYQITANFPAVQSYQENSFGQFVAPMVAVTKDNYDNAFKFKNVASIFKVQIKKGNEDKTISRATISSEEHAMAGKYTITASNEGEPSFKFGSEAVQTITLDCGENGVVLTEEGVLFVFVIPYQTYASGKLTFTFYTTDDEYMSFSSEKEYEVGRSESYIIKNKTYLKTGEVQHFVKDANGNATIYTVKGLQQLAAEVNATDGANDFAGKTITLADNLDLSDIADWTPIGNGSRSGNAASGNSFKGTFDGQGHAITGLNIISGNDDNAVGLFGVVDGGTVKNVVFENVNINASSSELTGAAVGFLTGGGVVDEVKVSGEITANKGVGGIVGRATVSATISNCENFATINATNGNAGGIVGAAYYTSIGNVYTGENAALVINNCTNSGDVTTSAGGYTGGIAGLSSVSVTNCTNIGKVQGSNTSVGGIVGEQKESGEVIGCTNSGTVTNTASTYGTGGIIGWVRYPASEAGSGKAYEVQNVIIVKGNTNTASVSGGNDAGGIVGTVYNYAVVTENNNSAASLSSSTFAAGIVGNIQFNDANNMVADNNISRMVEVTDNTSTTTLASMIVTGTCEAPYAYDNSQGANTKISGNRGCSDVQTEPVAEGVVKTAEGSYEISSVSGLKWLANQVNQENNSFSGVTIFLTGDVDLNNEAWKSIGHGFGGTGSTCFKGTFDGNNKTISNLKITECVEGVSTGLFGYTSGATIKNFTLENVDIEVENTGNGGVGAIVGVLTGCTAEQGVRNVIVKGNVEIDATRRIGGIVGYASGPVVDCEVNNAKLTAVPNDANGTIDNGDKVGGIAGYLNSDNNININNNRVANITIVGYRDLGGVVGGGYGTSVMGNSVTNGSITAESVNGTYAGGDKPQNVADIMGRIMSSTTNIVNNTSSNVTISCPDAVIMNGRTYTSLDNALKDAADGMTILLPAGNYSSLSNIAGKTVTIEGVGNETVFDFTKPYSVGEASITFRKMKFTGKNSNTMSGFGIQSTTKVITFEECTFVDAVTNEHNGSVVYDRCNFTGTYYITTYSVKSAKFAGCTFDRNDSRAILVYSHGDNPVQVTVSECEFKAVGKGYTGAGDWTAAVEIDTTYIETEGTTVTITDCSTDSNYNGMVRDKSAANAVKATITVNG